MAKRRLLHELFPPYFIITTASLIGIAYLAAHLVAQFHLNYVQAGLEARARYLDTELGKSWTAQNWQAKAETQTDVLQVDAQPANTSPTDAQLASKLCVQIAQASGVRLAVLDADGDVIADSERKAEERENQADRPEIVAARQKIAGSDTRYVNRLNERVCYFALPIVRHGKVMGIVQASQPVGETDRTSAQLRSQVISLGLGLMFLVTLVGYIWISRKLSRPISEIRSGAERFARGDLDYKLPLPENEDLAGLADALNQMATQLQERIRTIVQQGNEQQAVVGSMVEGVLAIDNQERIISLNKSTCQLLDIDEAHAQGRMLQEVVRNADLRRFISRVLKTDRPIDDDVILHGNSEGVLQARGAALHDALGRAIGAVIVLNDVTEFRRLEHIRRDFVANVSHELKTPVAAIKGFVETLLDGAMHNATDSERFLQIVNKQADRLNSIIEDLLSLSKIEQGEDSGNIVLENVPLNEVLATAVHESGHRAAERQITVEMICDPDLMANVNAPLLEQAIINLLDNAVKYSEPEHQVQIIGSQTDQEITIRVIDQGCGIAAEHLSRVFERFYRVDKARSRKLGGTGLGLAIVKHIVQAHGGRVTVKSTPGVGSTFTLHLPIANSA